MRRHDATSPIGAVVSSGSPRREQFVDWVSGACLLVHRADAEAVGLLDERYFLYTEDVDFCAAIRAAGGGSCSRPPRRSSICAGVHAPPRPAPSHAAYRRSQLAFYEKHHPAWAPVLRLYLRFKGDSSTLLTALRGMVL